MDKKIIVIEPKQVLKEDVIRVYDIINKLFKDQIQYLRKEETNGRRNAYLIS